MNNLFNEESDPLEQVHQVLEQEKQELLANLQVDAQEVLRCFIKQTDNFTNGVIEIGKVYPNQTLLMRKAAVALAVARSYFSEALNDMILNPQPVEFPQ